MSTQYHDEFLQKRFALVYSFVEGIMRRELPKRGELGTFFGGGDDPGQWAYAFLFFRSLKRRMTSVYDPAFEDASVQNMNADLVRLYQECEDDDEFERKLRVTVQYWLSDRFDQTEYGLIRRKLEADMETGGSFKKASSDRLCTQWHLKGYPSELTTSSMRRLYKVAVEYAEVIPWPSEKKMDEYLQRLNAGEEGVRRPKISRRPVREMLRAVLVTADGAVEINTLTTIFIQLHPAIARTHTALYQYGGEFDLDNVAGTAISPLNQLIDAENEEQEGQ